MLSTIGYEGARPEHFLATLQRAGIEVLIDIRDRAQSRRPGFSKGALSQSLTEAGIEYCHFKELGDPREGRLAARAGDRDRFLVIYNEVLESVEAQRALLAIAGIAAHRHVCLMCYERDHRSCHRAIVAVALSGTLGVAARHLGVQAIEPARKSSRRVHHPDQGAAA